MNDSVTGKNCPYCSTPIKENRSAVICSECGMPHHEECWRENGGCTTFGCQGKALTSREGELRALTPNLAHSTSTSELSMAPSYPADRPSRGSKRRPVVWASVGVVVVLLVGVVIGVSLGRSESAPSPRPTEAAAAVDISAPAVTLDSSRPASSDQPFRMVSQIEDRVGALQGSEIRVQDALDQLQSAEHVQLWVVYLNTFFGMGGQDWADETAVESDLGLNDVLLAVAVQDRAYAYSVDQDFPLSNAELIQVMSVAVEPALVENDWAEAVIGCATGLGQALRGEAITEPSTTAQARAETGETKTYTDATYDYSFDYPGSWQLQEGDTADVSAGGASVGSVGVYDPKGAVAEDTYIDMVQVSVYELSVVVDESVMPEIKAELEAVLESLQSQAGDLQTVEPLAEITGGGIDGYKVTYSFAKNSAPVISTLYVLLSGDREYQLTVQAASENWEKNQSVFQTITGSFRPG